MDALLLPTKGLLELNCAAKPVLRVASVLEAGKIFADKVRNEMMHQGILCYALNWVKMSGKSYRRFAFAFIVLIFACQQTFAQDLDTLRGVAQFEAHNIPYVQISKIPEGTNDAEVPVFVFLHGAGERGTDNALQITVGLPALINSLEAQKVPCYIIYAPQCPVEEKWVDTDWTLLSHKMGPKMHWPLATAMQGLNELMTNPVCDPDRIYLTGISMGGFGTWELLQRYPQQFAAGIPICGGGDPAFAEELTQTPIWAFHGKKDKLVKVIRTSAMIDAVVNAGGNPKVTLFDDLGHLCWNTVYKDQAVVAWLISQERNAR